MQQPYITTRQSAAVQCEGASWLENTPMSTKFGKFYGYWSSSSALGHHGPTSGGVDVPIPDILGLPSIVAIMPWLHHRFKPDVKNQQKRWEKLVF